jgi:23S rRNA pseudouridine2605 synthase
MVKHGKTARTGLARALSKLGYCSRSDASKLISDGRVRLNGISVRNPEQPVFLSRDQIEVDGQRIDAPRKIYLAMNKPRGIVTTAPDERQRETVLFSPAQ